ncbi:MAG: hypothetical protein F6K32_19700 [Desertifilum sp. SIO1I2]|nr:hypothetical protein [Desertifilum sp. SIO1I2]
MNPDRHRDLDDRDRKVTHPDANPDPISGEPGSHPVGTGVGAAGLGAVGAALGGVIAGPVGAVVGAAGGAVAGGLMGKGIAESVDPTVEDAYWRENYVTRRYYNSAYDYNDYQPAYRMGFEGYAKYANTGRSYDEFEPELQRDYETRYPDARLRWPEARYASRDAWDRVHHNTRRETRADDFR